MKIKVTKLYAKQPDGTLCGALGFVGFHDIDNILLHTETINGKTDSPYFREVSYSGEYAYHVGAVFPINGTFEYELVEQ